MLVPKEIQMMLSRRKGRWGEERQVHKQEMDDYNYNTLGSDTFINAEERYFFLMGMRRESEEDARNKPHLN